MRARKAAERMVESKFKAEVTQQKQKLKEVKLIQGEYFLEKLFFSPTPHSLKSYICWRGELDTPELINYLSTIWLIIDG